jgi:hypothetical protein
MAEKEPMPSGRPDPDPTTLTTAQLQREIATSREIIHGEIIEVKGVTEAKIASGEKLVQVLHEFMGRIYAQVDTRVNGVEAVIKERFVTVDEKFSGVEKQFVERDVRVLQSAAAATTAVNAALQAQKEAAVAQNSSFTLSIDKTEKATGEQIVQQRTLLQTATGSLSDKIDDLKSRFGSIESHMASIGSVEGRVGGIESRMNALEGRMNGNEGRRAGHGESWQLFVAAIGVACLIAGIVVALWRHS